MNPDSVNSLKLISQYKILEGFVYPKDHIDVSFLDHLLRTGGLYGSLQVGGSAPGISLEDFHRRWLGIQVGTPWCVVLSTGQSPVTCRRWSCSYSLQSAGSSSRHSWLAVCETHGNHLCQSQLGQQLNYAYREWPLEPLVCPAGLLGAQGFNKSSCPSTLQRGRLNQPIVEASSSMAQTKSGHQFH